MAKKPKLILVVNDPDVEFSVAQPAAETPADGYFGEDYRLILGRPDLSAEWCIPDPMQIDRRPEKPKG